MYHVFCGSLTSDVKEITHVSRFDNILGSGAKTMPHVLRFGQYFDPGGEEHATCIPVFGVC